MDLMEKIVSLARRRGFIFQSSEIYGGINGFWDYGPLGVELKRNLKNAWWEDLIHQELIGPNGKPVDIVGLDSTIIMNPKVWIASGHAGGFSDPMQTCKKCKKLFRADHITVEGKITLVCPSCAGELTEPRQFNLMFTTQVGALQDEASHVYLRPETAQGTFVNFHNAVDSSRVKIPFGMAQIGKSFRNELTPRNFTFRSREFEQMELEFFVHPSEARTWYEFWRQTRYQWWLSLGLSAENLRIRDHEVDELAHYAKEGAGVCDIEYRFPFTAPDFGELEGIAHRSDFDLRQHAQHCGLGDKMRYFDAERNERYFPHVIEPASGADRGVLALLAEAYQEDETRPSKVYLKLHPRLAPVKAAIFPLVNKDGMPEVAQKLYRDVRRHFVSECDVKQSIGKRYARMDEIGTLYCFTIDGQTLQDQTVTSRHRDTMKQERISIDQVVRYLTEHL